MCLCPYWYTHCPGLIASSTCSTSISTNNTYIRNPGYLAPPFWTIPAVCVEIQIHAVCLLLRYQSSNTRSCHHEDDNQVPKLLHPGQHRQLCLHHQQGQCRRLSAPSRLWGDCSLQHMFSFCDWFVKNFYDMWKKYAFQTFTGFATTTPIGSCSDSFAVAGLEKSPMKAILPPN